MKVKKLIRFFSIVLIALWLFLTTYISYRWLREKWIDFLIEDSKDFVSYISDSPVSYENKDLNFGDYFIETPFVERLGNLEESVFLDLLNYDLEVYVDLPDRDNKEYLERFKMLYKSWPPQLKAFAESLIFKVFIVKGLSSSGRIVSINDRSGFVILINESQMILPPNVWITGKEELNFYPPDNNSLFQTIIEDYTDPVLTFENILIHEIGHAVGVATELTPDFNNRGDLKTVFPFYKETYEEFITKFEKKNKIDQLFERLHYYDTAYSKRLQFDEYCDLLDQLKETSYPTTYSSRNHAELFAEIFYSYVHCILQKKPFKYVVTDKNGDTTIVQNGIREERCSYERSFVESLFETARN